MSYYEKIKRLIDNVPETIVDFSLPRDQARTPTQASSNFITNKEQGDWAENLVTRAINETSTRYIAIKYGKSDNVVAGEEGFNSFYEEFQRELDTIGKRPDLLIFNKSNYNQELGYDISQLPHYQTTEYVKKAIAGIEVRSSAFLIDRYEAAMHARTARYTTIALEIKDMILREYNDLLEQDQRRRYIPILESLSEDTLSVANFRIPTWSSSGRLVALKNHFIELKNAIKEIQKRDYLSITPKAEDIKVVYKWIETFKVPHFYFQVFFDKVYGISFEKILEVISNSNNEGELFSIEQDTKNQNKTTIKINSKSGVQIAYKVVEPTHKSVRKEMDRGRLLFYVSFEGGRAYLDVEKLREILGVTNGEF